MKDASSIKVKNKCCSVSVTLNDASLFRDQGSEKTIWPLLHPINNNDTNFKAIISHRFRGYDFKKNPELAQKILERMVPNENFTYQGKQMRATIRSLDTNRLSDMMPIFLTYILNPYR